MLGLRVLNHYPPPTPKPTPKPSLDLSPPPPPPSALEGAVNDKNKVRADSTNESLGGGGGGRFLNPKTLNP